MPDLDGGHYFFTALLPIDNHGIVEHGAFKSSPAHMVRDALEALPTALQSPASEQIAIQSPFARSLRTHFVRLFVIDAAFYNGRDPADSVVSAIRSTDLLAAQPVDRLACPYLGFVADFDPADDAPEPRAWLEELWSLASPELSTVFEYCYGFDARGDASAFADFVLRGQVETTMPFNDYWTTPPPFPSLSPAMLAAPPVLGAALGLLIAAAGNLPIITGFLLILALLIPGVVFDLGWVTRRGEAPLPTAPHSTLRDVLKALYLQQAFTHFAAEQQGASTPQLRAAFARFVATTRPDDLDGPTQPPGVIRGRLTQAPADA
jgi:hypothetical protein